MVSEKVMVRNPNGLHLKPSGYLCNLALEFQCWVTLRVMDGHEKQVNAKSVLGILSSCLKYNQEVEIICDGSDEQEALKKIVEAFNSGLGEEI